MIRYTCKYCPQIMYPHKQPLICQECLERIGGKGSDPDEIDYIANPIFEEDVLIPNPVHIVESEYGICNHGILMCWKCAIKEGCNRLKNVREFVIFRDAFNDKVSTLNNRGCKITPMPRINIVIMEVK